GAARARGSSNPLSWVGSRRRATPNTPDPEHEGGTDSLRAHPDTTSRSEVGPPGDRRPLPRGTSDRKIDDVGDTDMRAGRGRSSHRRLARALLAVLLPAGLLLTAGPAAAEPPLDLPDQVYAPDGRLDTGRVEAALETLEDEAGLQLFVAYVDSFDGLDGVEWAEQTFDESGMGGNDVLLAVAVGDRRYGTWTTGDSGLTPEGNSLV